MKGARFGGEIKNQLLRVQYRVHTELQSYRLTDKVINRGAPPKKLELEATCDYHISNGFFFLLHK